MDLFDGYIDFKREIFVGEQGCLIKKEDFENYTARFGYERALGYLQALNDFNAYAEVILGGGYCRNGVPETPHLVKKYLQELTDHNYTFLTKFGLNSASGIKL